KVKDRPYFIAALATVVVVVVALAWGARPQPSAFELFWAPVLEGPHNVLLSIPQFSEHVQLEGVDDPKLTWRDPLTPTPDPMGLSWSAYSRRLIHVSDVAEACRVAEFLGRKGKHAVIKGEHDLTLRDLRQSPAVILGGLANQWTSKSLPQARFTFAGE